MATRMTRHVVGCRMTRHVIACRLTHETRVGNALYDVANDMWQALCYGHWRRARAPSSWWMPRRQGLTLVHFSPQLERLSDTGGNFWDC